MVYTVHTRKETHGVVSNFTFAEILADTVARETHTFVWVVNEVGEVVYQPFPRNNVPTSVAVYKH